MAMTDPLLSEALTAFQLFNWLNVVDSDNERDTMEAMIEVARRLALDAFLPTHRLVDVEEPTLEQDGVHVHPAIHDALAKYRELGLFGASFPQELGGLALPFTASLAIYGNFVAANPSAAGYPMLTAANARLIAAFGNPEQVNRFVRPQVEGQWFGTMCLSEPQAGSSLGDIRTRAIADGADELGQRYRLFGNKMWISGGDHDVSENIVHLVLAKIQDAAGAIPEDSKGISLFIVPKLLPDGAMNDIAVAGLNHKLGYRGTSNCLLNFGEKTGAIGWRVGEAGQGLAQMFRMMNEARISVGMGAAAMAYRGYRHAIDYARDRTQGRPIGVRGGAPFPILAHADVRRMLLQQKAYAEGALALCLYCASLVDEGGGEAEMLLALLTPVAKSWPSEFGLIANDLAIQVHGGYGYTRDFDVELLWRDNRLNPIHEGTNGIQAIDLLGRKILSSNGAALRLLRSRIDMTASAAAQHRLDFAGPLKAYWDRVSQLIETLRQRDGAHAFEAATPFLRAFGHGVVAWLWLDQTVCVKGSSDHDLKAGIEHACRYFFEAELPQAEAWLQIVSLPESAARAIPDSAFG